MKLHVMAAACLLLTPMIASCSTTPDPSKDAFLKLALEATKEPVPTMDCPPPITVTDFPKVLLVNILTPINHIQQGDSYGTDLELAHGVHKANSDKVDEYIKACDKGFETRQKAYERREEIRAKLLTEQDEEKDTGSRWNPFD